MPTQNTSSDILDSALWQYLLKQELALYNSKVNNIFGFNALQLGWIKVDFLSHSRMPRKIMLNSYSSHPLSNQYQLVGETEFLPLAEQSIDLVCMPHILEMCTQPQQSLREIERVMVAEGTLILTGFRPWSLIGRRITWGKSSLFANHHTLFSIKRIKDWLNLLGFECLDSGTIAYALPTNDDKWLRRMQFCDGIGHYFRGCLGSVYYIVAKKRVVNMRLIKMNWKTKTLKQTLAVQKSQDRRLKAKIGHKFRDEHTSLD